MPVCPPSHVLLRVGNTPALFASFFICLSYPYFLPVGIILAIFVFAARRFCSPTFAGFLLVAEAAEAKSGAVHCLLILLLLCYVIREWHCLPCTYAVILKCYCIYIQAVCDCNNEPMRWRNWCNSILWDFTTRPCRSVFFRCDDEEYLFRFITPAFWCAASF